jgi:hypothetical protein
MKRGGLAGRVAKQEDSGAGECQACRGRAPHGGCFMQQADGTFRDHTGRKMPDGPDEWTCPICMRTYSRPRVVIHVVGRRDERAPSVRRATTRSALT